GRPLGASTLISNPTVAYRALSLVLSRRAPSVHYLQTSGSPSSRGTGTSVNTTRRNYLKPGVETLKPAADVIDLGCIGNPWSRLLTSKPTTRRRKFNTVLYRTWKHIVEKVVGGEGIEPPTSSV